MGYQMQTFPIVKEEGKQSPHEILSFTHLIREHPEDTVRNLNAVDAAKSNMVRLQGNGVSITP